MRTWLPIALVTCLAAVPSRAEVPEVQGPPMTALDAGVLRRCQLVAVGRVESATTVRQGRGVQISHVVLDRVLRGAAPERITLVSGGPRPTNDPRAPSVPYLEPHPERPMVFFLRRKEGGEGWRLVTAFAVEGALGAEKIGVLQRHVELAAVPGAESRARATLAFLLEAEAEGGTWTRVHAARELNHLVRVRPEIFDAEVKAALEKAAKRARIPEQRTWLARVLERLRCVVPAPEAGPGVPPDVARLREALGEAADEDARFAILRQALEQGGSRGLHAVFLVLPEQDPGLRRRLVETLADGGWRAALPAIQGLYAREDDPDVLRAVVAAVGRLGGLEAVGWLEARSRSLRVRKEAIRALGRIRAPEARAALERIRARLEVDPHGDKDVTALVDHVLGQAPAPRETEGGGAPR